MTPQLPLPVGLRDGNTLDSFLGEANPEALAAVARLLEGGERAVLLWGAPDTGRTHLLEAAADAAARAGRRVIYVPCAGIPPGDLPALLAGAGELDLVCLDDVQAAGGDAAAEEALFHLYNRLQDRGARLLASADGPPHALPLQLADLRSRLGACLVVALRPLDDGQRLAVLAWRARRRGLELPAETGRYLLARGSRRLADLVGLLAELDHASLARQRRLTIPLVREVLAGRMPGGER